MGYVTLLIRYTDRPANGKYDMRNQRFEQMKEFKTLADARKCAYKWVEHSGSNVRGIYLCIIARISYDGLIFSGEVMNTAYDDRYWYPSDDGKYAGAGKYTLYKNGTLGTKWR